MAVATTVFEEIPTPPDALEVVLVLEILLGLGPRVTRPTITSTAMTPTAAKAT
jgi:hypothetical protein